MNCLAFAGWNMNDYGYAMLSLYTQRESNSQLWRMDLYFIYLISNIYTQITFAIAIYRSQIERDICMICMDEQKYA